MIQLICLQFPLSFEPRSHPCSTPSSSHTWKSTRKAPHTSPQKEQMHSKNCNHNKLSIYYAKIKSFTDSSLVLSIQGTATNCKGIAMEASSQTMNVNVNVNTFSELTWRSMRKETCTNNELGEFLMVLGIGKHTGHSTLKNAKGKAFSPRTLPNTNIYRAIGQILVLQKLSTTSTEGLIHFIKELPHYVFEYHRPVTGVPSNRCGLGCRIIWWLGLYINLQKSKNTFPPTKETTYQR